MAKIIHLADLHIGAKLDFLQSDTNILLEKQLEELKNVVDFSNDSGVDAILIAGDLFDSPTTALSIANHVFSILSKSFCPVLISAGNHDYIHSQSPYKLCSIPEGIYIFEQPMLQAFPLDEQTVIYGASFHGITADIALDIPVDPTKTNICVVHGELEGDNGYNYLSNSKIEQCQFDYIALGHNHRFSGILHNEDTYFACTGAFLPVSIASTGTLGYIAGNVQKGNVNLTFIKQNSLEIQAFTLDISTISNDSELQQLISKYIPQNCMDVCALFTFTGIKKYDASIAELKIALDSVFLYCSLRDETKIQQDIWKYLNDDGLKGEVTRKFKQNLSTAQTEQQKQHILLALEYAVSALEGD